MELRYVHVKVAGGQSRYFYFLPLGGIREGRITGLNTSMLTDDEVLLIKRQKQRIEALGPRDRYEFLKLILPSFSRAYREIYPENIVEAFTYDIR